MPASDFDAVPGEMRAYRQWVVWQLQERDGKATKAPLRPVDGRLASVTNPDDWSDFDTAVAAARAQSLGVGFVFTPADPFTGIDIDHVDNPDMASITDRILSIFPSYTERSPSYNGLHVIVKGKVPHGRRRDGVELYSSQRYFTVTGDVVRNLPIADAQGHLDILFNEMASARASAAGLQADEPERASDAEVVAAILAEPATSALYNTNPATYTGDRSGADQALCNWLAVRFRNREQVRRVWLASPLGQRAKTQTRADYQRRTVEAAFDRQTLPQVDLGGVTCGGRPVTVGTPLAPQRGSAEPQQPLAGPPADLVIDAGDWHGKVPLARAYQIAGFVPAGLLTMVYGAGGGGKSLLGQLMATAVALGVPCLGHSTAQSPALYVTCEDDPKELHRRQVSICVSLKTPLDRLKGKLKFASLVEAMDSALVTFDVQGRMAPTAAFHWLKAVINENQSGLVILDNVAHFFSGNENIRNQVAAFLGLLNSLAMETGAAIVLIGHPNKNGDHSGSTAWSNQVRNRLDLTIPTEPDGKTIRDRDARLLTVGKSNYSRVGEKVGFRWHDGAFVIEADLAELERDEIAANSQARFEDERFLHCLAVATEQKRNVSHMKGINYAPNIFTRMPESSGLTVPAFERAFERLNSRGIILLDQQLGWRGPNRVMKQGIALAFQGAGA